MLDDPSLRRVLQDLLRHEITLARHGTDPQLPNATWPDSLALGQGGLEADSLELLTLAGAVNRMFHVHESGIEDGLLVRRRFGDWVELVTTSWAAHASQISFHSSGSTGQPKTCTHSMADLIAEAREHAARLNPRRILSAVPSHHIYGFIFAVLLPLCAGCEVVDIRQRLPAADVFRDGDVIVSFPEHWRFIAQSMASLPPVTGISSTAPMPSDLASAVRERGLARLVEIYGSSETAGIGWRDDHAAPFTLLDGWSVAVFSAADGILALSRGGQTIAVPDCVAMAGARAIHVGRRRDGAVQVGGVNVYPARIANTLEQHPAVAQALVRLATPGGRLKALVVPSDPNADPDTLLRELNGWITSHLTAAERPRSISLARQLPAGAMGKLGDWVEPLP